MSPDLPIFEDPDRFRVLPRGDRRPHGRPVRAGVGAPWSLDKVPDDFSFGEIPSDWDRLGPFLEYGHGDSPRSCQNVGIRKLFTGPESFTPDNGFLIGEAPELKNFFIAAGFNSLGILTGGRRRARSSPTGSSTVFHPSTSRMSIPPGWRSLPDQPFLSWRSAVSSCSAGSTRRGPGPIHTRRPRAMCGAQSGSRAPGGRRCALR